MGTRHLIAAKVNGEYKLAQYGQWDGHPDGQGVDVLFFLRQNSLEKLKSKLIQCREISDESIAAIHAQFGSEPGQKSWEKFADLYPQHSRDTGAKILGLIYDSIDGADLKLNINFAGDSLMCEWAYVIEFDANTFEVFKGFNEIPLEKEERFYHIPCPRAKYKQVRLWLKYSLDDLPTIDKFINDAALKMKEYEEAESAA